MCISAYVYPYMTPPLLLCGEDGGAVLTFEQSCPLVDDEMTTQEKIMESR